MVKDSRKNETLLRGRALPSLILFALPIILGNIFQQLYNIVDAMVVGKYLGDLPLAGISIASPIMDILYALLLGASIGISVLTGHLTGSGDMVRLKKVHGTALIGGSLFTLLLSAAALLSSRSILLAQGSDPEVVREAMSYLIIILGGLIFSFLYNYFAALLRSWGNSRTPFWVLLFSSVLHALLDLLLCGLFGLGIYGVACSTVFCQLVSTLWLALYTHRHCPPLRLSRKDLRFDRQEARVILSYAWAAALQQAVVMLGRFLIQGMLTPLGTPSVTGYNMSMRVEQFLFCFSQGISAAMVVGISLNHGKGQRERVKAFYFSAIGCELALWALLGLILFFFAPHFIRIFSDNEEVIAAGASYGRTMALPYLFAFLGEVIQGYFRGIGRLRLTMAASLSQIVLRVLLSAL
ncbi:MAG: MATE family efflux transporter, partial [Lachnospiraceae bacterium]|nr:MATE family efflux transporter [Lachnospiraceae bacterium]